MTIKTALGISFITAAGMLAYSVIQVVLSYPWLLLLPGVPVLGLVGWFLWNWIMVIRERRLTVRAQRLQEEHVIKVDDFGMLHLINLASGHSQNLTLDARTYRNGHYEEPTPREHETLRYLLASRHAGTAKAVITEPSQLLPAPPATAPELIDLINQYPHVHIFGRTGNGKTSLLRIIGHNRVATGHKVFVLDSNDHPAEWVGLTRIKDPDEQDSFIARALTVHRLNSEALADGRAIERDFEQITILSNEWTDIVKRTEAAALFIDEMSRKSRKSGFHCGFSTQTKLAADLGLDGRYQVIRNFIQIELLQSPDGVHTARCVADGKFLAEINVPAPPPRPAMLSNGYTPPDIDIVEIIASEAKITEKQQEVLDIWDSGLQNEPEIARQVYGTSGGKQIELVHKTLVRHQRTAYERHVPVKKRGTCL